MSETFLSIQNLCKFYPSAGGERAILSDISFELSAGRSLAVMGPSGSGKSTLLNIVGTLDAPTRGQVAILGQNPFALDEAALAKFRNRTVGFIFQLHHLLPQCSVLENVLLPSLVHRGERKESADARARRLIERVGLTPRMHARPGQLSGGECQRAAVVRALINEPRLLLADEPTGSLDEASVESIGALLVELKQEENVALLVVTHSPALAARMDATARLKSSRLVFDS